MGDQSQSMYKKRFGDINIQREGILEALQGYHPRCNSIRVTYVSWGDDTSSPIVGYLDDNIPTTLLTSIREESFYSQGGTHHALAWRKALTLVQPGEQTAIVYLTNDSGKPLGGNFMGGSLLKVSVLSEDALQYLAHDFLPNHGQTVYAQSVEDIAVAITTALQAVDTMCIG
jgi:hypothetical protein